MKRLSVMSCARRLRAITGAATVSCALSGVVPAPSPPIPVPPVVRLGVAFSPATLRLAVGQQFELVVSSAIQATGADIPSTCSGVIPGGPGALLSVQCMGNGDYLYTAEQPGTAVLSAMVRPRCAPGDICPQWIAEANLTITITPCLPPGPVWPFGKFMTCCNTSIRAAVCPAG